MKNAWHSASHGASVTDSWRGQKERKRAATRRAARKRRLCEPDLHSTFCGDIKLGTKWCVIQVCQLQADCNNHSAIRSLVAWHCFQFTGCLLLAFPLLTENVSTFFSDVPQKSSNPGLYARDTYSVKTGLWGGKCLTLAAMTGDTEPLVDSRELPGSYNCGSDGQDFRSGKGRYSWLRILNCFQIIFGNYEDTVQYPNRY